MLNLQAGSAGLAVAKARLKFINSSYSRRSIVEQSQIILNKMSPFGFLKLSYHSHYDSEMSVLHANCLCVLFS
jgi:hypothetical protein